MDDKRMSDAVYRPEGKSSLLIGTIFISTGSEYKQRGIKQMADWIPFEDGRYRVNEAFLVAASEAAVVLDNPYIEIFTGRTGKRWLKGGSLVQNLLVVELLDESDSLDILLNLTEEFKFILRKPEIQAGKVFAPDVKSSLKFMPVAPWEPVTPDEFRKICSRLRLQNGSMP